MEHSVKKVCVFGIYDPKYPHNGMLIRGLQENGYDVVEYTADPKKFPGIKKYRELARVARREIPKTRYSFILVLFPGHTIVWLARILFPKTRIVFDAFVSLYDSNVFDRKRYSRWDVRAVRDWLLDWSSTALAWKVLLDTNAHIDYFVSTFGVSREKCIRVFVGTDGSIFWPRALEIPENPFVVHFHGTYIPLQGIPYILEAARLVHTQTASQEQSEIRNEKGTFLFRIIGSSTTSEYARTLREGAADLVKEGVVEFIDAIPLASLAEYMREAHVSLGIFGDTEKTQRVIPNKVYEALAMGKPILTADTPAARELLSEKTAMLIPAADPAALAQSIQHLRAHPEERLRLAAAAADLFQSQLQPKKLVGDMLAELKIGTIQ